MNNDRKTSGFGCFCRLKKEKTKKMSLSLANDA